MGEKVKDFLGASGLDAWPRDIRGFTSSVDAGHIAGVMRYVKDNHVSLSLVSAVENICQPSLLINMTKDSLQIDKPLEWDDSIESFRVFFRDIQQRWNYFLISELCDHPFSLSVAMPEELHVLQRRVCNRVRVPLGTRALIKRGNDMVSTVFINDLSSAGMSMCNDPADGDYATDSVIRDIEVSIPSFGNTGEISSARKVLPVITQGRVVRSFIDKETCRPCYGVSFAHDSNYVKETIHQVVSAVEREALSAGYS